MIYKSDTGIDDTLMEQESWNAYVGEGVIYIENEYTYIQGRIYVT